MLETYDDKFEEWMSLCSWLNSIWMFENAVGQDVTKGSQEMSRWGQCVILSIPTMRFGSHACSSQSLKQTSAYGWAETREEAKHWQVNGKQCKCGEWYVLLCWPSMLISYWAEICNASYNPNPIRVDEFQKSSWHDSCSNTIKEEAREVQKNLFERGCVRLSHGWEPIQIFHKLLNVSHDLRGHGLCLMLDVAHVED